MALRLGEIEPRPYEYVITPTGDELPEMLEHWERLGELLGRPLRVLTSGHSLRGLIRQWGALPNWRQRWCTRVLKIEPSEAYLLRRAPCVSYVGLRADEEERTGVQYKSDAIQVRHPLVEWGWGLREVLDYLAERGVTIPDRTDCARCFYQRLGEWYFLWRDHPDLYASAEADEAATGHTFRSPGRDTWPAGLAELRAEFEGGRLPRGVSRAAQGQLFESRPMMCRVCRL